MPEYTFFQMIKDTFFNGNKVSEEFKDSYSSGDDTPTGGGGSSAEYPCASGDFDPSDTAGEGFRSVFGND